MPVTLTYDLAQNKQGTLDPVKCSAATVDDIEDTASRQTRAFWHRFPKDDAWRECTFASSVKNGFRYQPCCRNCWHSGEIMTPAEVSAWAKVPMDTPIIALAARLVCSRCDHPAGYFHLHNPQVKAHGAP